MEYKHAIFDMDGTLVDSIPYWRQLYLEYLASRGVSDPPAGIMRQTVTMTSPEAAALFIQSFGLSDTQDQAVGEILRLIEAHYRADVQLKEGVEDFLRRLQAEGWKMCVASATAPGLVDLCLRRLGIRDYFQFLLSCVEVGVGKTRPDVYLEAARRLGCSPQQAIVFEDSLVPATTAKNAGFRVAGIYDPSAGQDCAPLKAIADWYLLRWDGESFLAQFH